MIKHSEIESTILHTLIKHKLLIFGGNLRLRIYGALNCSSGKKMKKGNRVFFFTKEDALSNGFRPCGHCMRAEYKKWKNGTI